jgi:hypothetical protein
MPELGVRALEAGARDVQCVSGKRIQKSTL